MVIIKLDHTGVEKSVIKMVLIVYDAHIFVL